MTCRYIRQALNLRVTYESRAIVLETYCCCNGDHNVGESARSCVFVLGLWEGVHNFRLHILFSNLSVYQRS